MKISAVTMTTPSNGYKNLNFGRRENESGGYSEYSPSPSHKLAVPLAATILAMSPMSVHSENAGEDRFADIAETEMYAPEVNQTSKEKLVETIWLPKELELEGNSAILLLDTNGNPSDIEKAILRTYKGNLTKDTELESFEISRSVDKKNNKVDSLFFAVGKTTTTKKLANGTKQVFHNGNMRMISQKAFDYLTRCFGDSFPINVKTHEKKPRSYDPFIDIIVSD